jgi:hypothetical protein
MVAKPAHYTTNAAGTHRRPLRFFCCHPGNCPFKKGKQSKSTGKENRYSFNGLITTAFIFFRLFFSLFVPQPPAKYATI